MTVRSVNQRSNHKAEHHDDQCSDDELKASLKKLAECAEWPYVPRDKSTVLGHVINCYYTADAIVFLTVDEVNHADDALVWRDDVYVNINFLRALDLDVSLPGNQMVINFTDPE